MITIIILSSVMQFVVCWLIMRKAIKNDVVKGYTAEDEIKITLSSLIPGVGLMLVLVMLIAFVKMVIDEDGFANKFFMIKGR